MNETPTLQPSLRPGTFFEKQTNLSLHRKIPEYLTDGGRNLKVGAGHVASAEREPIRELPEGSRGRAPGQAKPP